jgi:hypothetical protein
MQIFCLVIYVRVTWSQVLYMHTTCRFTKEVICQPAGGQKYPNQCQTSFGSIVLKIYFSQEPAARGACTHLPLNCYATCCTYFWKVLQNPPERLGPIVRNQSSTSDGKLKEVCAYWASWEWGGLDGLHGPGTWLCRWGWCDWWMAGGSRKLSHLSKQKRSLLGCEQDQR